MGKSQTVAEAHQQIELKINKADKVEAFNKCR